MTPSTSIFDSALALVEHRASAESYLLRIVLSAPAETTAVLRSMGARAEVIWQDDYRVMFAEAMALAMRRRNLSQLDALRNVIVGLREAECWDLSAKAVIQGPRWTVKGLFQFATWFGERSCGQIAASIVGREWRRVELIDRYCREATRCWTTANRIIAEACVA